MLDKRAHEGHQSPSNPKERKRLKEAQFTAQEHSAAHPSPPQTRGAISASLEGSPPRPSTTPHVFASLEATPRRKGQTAIYPPARRTEALNANNSATAPGSDGVRPPLRTVAVTRVISDNSDHCSANPGAVAALWEPGTLYETCAALLLPLCCLLHVPPLL